MSYILQTPITLGQMAPQTPGAVLLYDASGNAIAYAPGTAGQVLTANGAGLPPTWQAAPVSFTNSGTANGRAHIPIQIDRQVLAAAGTVTTAAWTAGAYRKIIVDFKGSLGGAGYNYIGFRANADAGANYSSQNYLKNGTGAPTGTVAEVGLTQARVALGVVTSQGFEFHIEIDPRTDGTARVGKSWSGTLHPSVLANSYGFDSDFSWNDTATNLTFITLIQYGGAGSTMTGELVVTGIPS